MQTMRTERGGGPAEIVNGRNSDIGKSDIVRNLKERKLTTYPGSSMNSIF